MVSLLYEARRAKGMTLDEARTALRSTNRRLEATRGQLETITETMSAAVAHVDRDGRFLWANANYAARLNRTPEDLAGATLITTRVGML